MRLHVTPRSGRASFASGRGPSAGFRQEERPADPSYLHCRTDQLAAVRGSPAPPRPRRGRPLLWGYSSAPRVLGPLVGGPVVGERRGRVRWRVAPSAGHWSAIRWALSAMASSSSRQYQRPAWGPSTTTASSALLPVRPRIAVGHIAAHLPGGLVGRGLRRIGRASVRGNSSPCAAQCWHGVPRGVLCTGHPHRTASGPLPRGHRSSPVDLDRLGRPAGGTHQAQGRRVFM